MMIIVNPKVRPTVYLLGENKIPLLVMDDYALNMKTLSAHAEQSEFKVDKVHQYPGVRAKLPNEYVISCLKPLLTGLYKLYKINANLTPTPKDNYFSLITTAEKDLKPIQTLPHFDTPKANLFAVIHYIGEGDHGGTGFFRHKPTQFDYINHERLDKYHASLQQYFESTLGDIEDINTLAELNKYCGYHHSEFECYQEIAYKPNRLVVFPGYLLHSTLVNVKTDIDKRVKTGRLTANMFVEFN